MITNNNSRYELKTVGMKYTKWTQLAMKICFEAHKNQTDKSGMPYVFHPFHLAEQMNTEAEICTAFLHDVVEDTDYTIEDIAAYGFSQEVVDSLKLLTHDSKVPYMEYVCAVRKNPVARKVKMADLKHNSDLNRLEAVDEKAIKRVTKYRIAQAILQEDRYDQAMKYYRKQIPLDGERLYFLSVFYNETGMVLKYSLDIEYASDCHIEFDAKAGEKLAKALDAKRSLPETLADFLAENKEVGFYHLLNKLGIRYQTFHFD